MVANDGPDVARPLRTRLGEPGVDGELGDGLAARRIDERGLEPGVELAHREAVLDHRLAHVHGLGVGLAALGERARVDLLDAPCARGLDQAERRALRVDQQRGIGRQRGDGRGDTVVRSEADAVVRERARERRVDLAGADEKRRRVGRDQDVGEEDRVEADVAAAQVQQPGDVVDGRDQVVARAGLGHRLPHLRELARARVRRLGAGVLVDRARRHRRAARARRRR